MSTLHCRPIFLPTNSVKVGKEISNLINKSDNEAQAATLTRCESAGDCFKQRSRSSSQLTIQKYKIYFRDLYKDECIQGHLVWVCTYLKDWNESQRKKTVSHKWCIALISNM